MAKEERNKSCLLKHIIAIIVLLLGFAVTFGMLKKQVSGNVEQIDTIKTEGCLPARKSGTDIEVIKKDVESILEKQDKFDTKQEAMDGKLDELLRRP